MKESTLIEMKKKIDDLTVVVKGLINEINIIKDFSMGTIETMMLMPGYEEAIEKLKKRLAEDSKKEETKLDI